MANIDLSLQSINRPLLWSLASRTSDYNLMNCDLIFQILYQFLLWCVEHHEWTGTPELTEFSKNDIENSTRYMNASVGTTCLSHNNQCEITNHSHPYDIMTNFHWRKWALCSFTHKSIIINSLFTWHILPLHLNYYQWHNCCSTSDKVLVIYNDTDNDTWDISSSLSEILKYIYWAPAGET